MRNVSRLARTLVPAAALAVLMVFAACGVDPTVTPPPPSATAPAVSPTATPVPPVSTPTTAPRPEPTSTPVPPPAPKDPVLPASIVDIHGNEVIIDDISRIVVLNGDITEVVFALGLGGNVVAVDTSATYPAEATELPKIGYQRSLSAEGILSMEPTLVIGNENAGPPEILEQVRSAGTPVVIIEAVSTLDGAPRKIRGVAQALGVPDRGEAVALEIEAQIREVKSLSAQAQKQPTAVFLYMRGLDSLFLIGRDHLSHELFEASGAISGGGAVVSRPFIPLTAESLADADPDCIFVLTEGLESVGGREGLLGIPGVAQTAAAEEDCIHDFDDQYFGGGGPRMGSVLMELLRIFQPDLAPAP